MPPQVPDHPDPQLIEAMSTGAQVPSEVIEHVAACPGCQGILAEFEQNNRFLSKMIRSARAADEESRRRQSEAVTAALSAGQPADILAGLPGLPGYEGLKEVHRGGQGVVFRARQIATKRDVAIKMPLSGSFLSQRAKVRFEREIELVAQLQHPNIVTVYDSGLTPDGRYYIVMELIDGVTLDRFLRSVSETSTQTGRQRITFIIKLFEKIALAVQHAHARGIVHRDLKPGNIIVDGAGEPHIVDFGLARRGEWDPETSPTIVDEFQGTPAYASPEQVGGDPRAIDVRTDVYSIGVMLYRALTGQWPYAVDGSLADQIRNIKQTPPQAPSRRVRGVSSDLDTVVLMALAKERERRYQSAGALAHDLRCALEGNPIAARPASIYYVVSKALVRNKPIAALVAAGLIAGAVVIVSYVANQRTLVRAANEVAQAQTAAAGLAQSILAKIGAASADSSGQQAFARRALAQSSADLDGGLAAQTPRTYVALRTQLAALFTSIGDTRAAVYQLQSASAALRAAPASARISPAEHAAVERDLAAAQEAAGMFADARATLESQLASLPVTSVNVIQRGEIHTAIARAILASGDNLAARDYIAQQIDRGQVCSAGTRVCIEACDVWARAVQKLSDVGSIPAIVEKVSPFTASAVPSRESILAHCVLLRCDITLGTADTRRISVLCAAMKNYFVSTRAGELSLGALADALSNLPNITQADDGGRTLQHADTVLTFAEVALAGQPSDKQLRTVAGLLERSRSRTATALFASRLLEQYGQSTPPDRMLFWSAVQGRAYASVGDDGRAASAFTNARNAYDALAPRVPRPAQLEGVKRDDLTLALVTALFETDQDSAALGVSAGRITDASGDVTLVRRIAEHVKLLCRCQRPADAFEQGARLLAYVRAGDQPALGSTRSDLELAVALAAARAGRTGAAFTLLTSSDAGILETAAENPMFARALNVRIGLVHMALGNSAQGAGLLQGQLTAVSQALPGTNQWSRLAIEALAQHAFASGDADQGNRWLNMLPRE